MVDDNAKGTAHPRIMCAQESRLEHGDLMSLLDNLDMALRNGDFDKARNIMQNAPIGYSALSPVTDVFAGSEGSMSSVPTVVDNVSFLDHNRE